MSFYEPILYVAEVGSNHCGSYDAACELIEAAKESGAGAVKFQLFTGDGLYGLTSKGARRKAAVELDKWALRPQWLEGLSKLTRQYGMQFIVTPFDLDSVMALSGHVDQVKISAYDLTYHKLIGAACKLDVPIILSTAMATPDEVNEAIDVRVTCKELEEITLLHGVAQYPADWMDYSTEMMCFLQSTGCKIGISDHTTDTSLGIFANHPLTMWERHFRLFQTPKESPDYAVSSDPKTFRDLIKRVEDNRRHSVERLEGGPIHGEKGLYRTCRRTDENPYRK